MNLKNIVFCLSLLTTLNVFASSIDAIASLPNAQQQIVTNNIERALNAISAAKNSTLVVNEHNKFKASVHNTRIRFYEVKHAAYGAISYSISFEMPKDPCWTKVEVISYNDGRHSVRPTNVYQGAIKGNGLGTLECED